MTSKTVKNDDPRHLIFQVGGQPHAIGLLEVREITECDTLEAIPSAPADLRGVMELRGASVPVLDLAPLLGFPPLDRAGEAAVLLVDASFDGRAAIIGLLVGVVSRVAEIPGDTIQPLPATGPEAARSCLKGVARLDGQFVPVLDLARVLAAPALGAPGPSTAEGDAAAPPSSNEPA